MHYVYVLPSIKSNAYLTGGGKIGMQELTVTLVKCGIKTINYGPAPRCPACPVGRNYRTGVKYLPD